MRAEIKTVDAKKMYDAIFKAIEDNKLETWILKESATKDRKFISPLANQYKDVIIEFRIVGRDLFAYAEYFSGDTKPTEAIKAIVLSMVSAALLTHLTEYFDRIELHHKTLRVIKVKDFRSK